MKFLFFLSSILCYSALATTTPIVIAKPNNLHSGCDLSVHGFKKREEFEKFFVDLKDAAKKADSKMLEKLVHYPLRVNQLSKTLIVKNEKEFQKNIFQIFTRKVFDAIAAQSLNEIFCNYQGAMIGAGEVWITQQGSKIRISSLNPY